MAPFISELKRNYIFGGISSVAANASIKVCIIVFLLKLLINRFCLDRMSTNLTDMVLSCY